MAGLSPGLSGIALSSLRQLSAALQRGGISPLGVCLYRAICQRAWSLLPRLLSKTWIRYGRNPGGTQRLQCQYCKKVWTPKQHALNVAETPEQICSIPLLVPFQGANAFQQLYFYSVLTLFAAIFFTFPAISRYCLPEKVCITTGKELRRPRARRAILFTVSPLKNGNFYSAASSMRFSMARRRLNGTRKEQYFARSLRRMVIFGC